MGVEADEEELIMLTPDHPITLEPGQRRWRAYFNGHVIADTVDALILREASLAPVVYFPRQDVAMEYMGRTHHRTHCPYKGEAAHYTLTLDGQIAENVAWSYEAPFEAMSAISGRVAFYPHAVEVYDVDEEAVSHRRRAFTPEPSHQREIDDIIQHTDSGAGVSQREHWPPNVETPQIGEGRGR